LAADQGGTYASHAYLPHGIPGFSTIAYELFDQLGDFGGTIVVPCGQGSLVLGIIRGFYSLQEDGLINCIQRVVAVQARKCAPIWAVYHFGSDGHSWVTEGDSKAEGVRIRYPLRGDQVISSLRHVDGDVIAVDEEDIDIGIMELAKIGFYVEPTSALVWTATSQIFDNTPEPIIVILTGSGLKNG
jgi:threonine synthase